MDQKLLLTGITAWALLAVASAAHADPLSTPAMTPPLAANPKPFSLDVLGSKIYITGQVTGIALWQDHRTSGDKESRVDFSNAQLEVQKTDGVLQFYVQAGAYSLPSLGTPYIKATDLPDMTYHYVPTAYVKFVPNENFNVQAGILPTLIGAEYTFTFQNMNIARGLLWNQEPAISRGVQANVVQGPVTASVALTDGYYSSRYSTVSTLVTYAVTKTDTLAFAASVQLQKNSKSRFATPVTLNNGQIFNLMWTHTDGPWTIEPYLQYGHVPKHAPAGITASASTYGVAVLTKYTFNPIFSLAGRAEYIDSSGRTNLLYGPKSKAYSFTLTPTVQLKTFFIRGEVSYTGLDNDTPGFGFGKLGDKSSQTRAIVETGFLF